jgi:hypothetical protein
VFNDDIRPWLEDRLKFKFDEDLILSIDDWREQVFKTTGLKLERADMFDVCKKEDVLFKLRKSPMFANTSTWLLDDAVNDHEIIHCIDNDSKFFIRNVKTMF